jgi:hypothetical protein
VVLGESKYKNNDEEELCKENFVLDYEPNWCTLVSEEWY